VAGGPAIPTITSACVDDPAEREGGRRRRHQFINVEGSLGADGFDRGQDPIDGVAVAAERQQQSLEMHDAARAIAHVGNGVDRLSGRHHLVKAR
jgi:hypothetical protein